jgi:hypothetical protein
MSNVVGPVCHIPPKTTPGSPQPFDTPGIPGPASDLQSAIALINALRLAIMQLTDQNDRRRDQGITNNFISQEDKPSDWFEVKRVTEKVRVYQNNDKTSPNYVDVEQMNSLTMRHRKTGALWRWNRNGQRR